ncbi:MAG: hypothetical protein ACE5QW_08060, partial [Thermoplasmata archaeon]
DSWIRREWVEIGPGEEAVDLGDYATEVQKIGLGLIKAHPTYEEMESTVAGREEVRELVSELSSVEVMAFPVPNDVP